jgi:hypothetical protein
MTMPKRSWLRRLLRMETDEQLKRWDDRLALLVGLVMVLIIAATAVGSLVMFVRIYQQGELPPGNPIDVIFASRLMVAAARLAILFIGVYIVLSVLRHMRRGQWLTGTGPLRVAEQVGTLERGLAEREEEIRLAVAENDRLKTTIAGLTSELRTSQQLLSEAQRQLRRKKD